MSILEKRKEVYQMYLIISKSQTAIAIEINMYNNFENTILKEKGIRFITILFI